MNKVSFQGERGAYSETAARLFFKEQIETIPCQTFAETLQSTTNNKSDFAILPVENSLEGSVGESYDLLYSTTLNVVGETYHKIEHCLIGTGKLEEIMSVYSHPQALGQCRNFLQQHNMKTVPTYDTAGSVNIIKQLNDRKVASIASKNAAEIYQMPIIKDGIADNINNYTRFLILAKNTARHTGSDKTSIIFSIKHEKGALFRIMQSFNDFGVNLTKIESRPTKATAWEYNFYVDFEGHVSSPDIVKMLEKIRGDSLFLKVLGSYPMAKI